MAATRRGQPELHVRLPSTSNSPSQSDLPPISALFLIDFDVKAGYTISWKAHRPDIELDGVVEYKSLPSGLHTVPDDLIYFVHDGYAGLSAFVNAPTDDSETRNARMLAVGVLVPLSYGRLGRAWKHAEGLKGLASRLALDAKDTGILQEYWEKHNAPDEESAHRPKPPQPKATNESLTVNFQPSPKGSPRSHVRNRSMSDGAALLPPGHKLSQYHPAWSLTRLLDTFGPLIFPIQRAALLRKRILISCHAPVHEMCNFVYNISILSNIPLSTAEALSPRSPPHRLRPLFTVGVHDIPFLMAGAKPSRDDPDTGPGWIACTTDSILTTKDNLCDMLITMPPAHAAKAQERVWPTIEYPRGAPHVKATQRDLRRYRALRAGLARLQRKQRRQSLATPSDSTAAAAAGKSSGSNSKDAEQSLPMSTELTEDEERRLIEPLTWAAFAYGGFMWWASAGEQARSDEAEEAAYDTSLLADLSSSTPFTPTMSMSTSGGNRQSVDLSTSMGSLARAPSGAGVDDEEDEARVELAVIAYFHRLTTRILGTLAEALDINSDEYSDSESEFDEDQDPHNPSARRDPRDDNERGAGSAEEEGDESEALLRPTADENENGDGDEDDGRGTGRRGARSRNRSRRPSGRNSIPVGSETVAAMGLDVWSAADAAFVAEIAARYFGRRAHVEGKGIEVCGVRVC